MIDRTSLPGKVTLKGLDGLLQISDLLDVAVLEGLHGLLQSIDLLGVLVLLGVHGFLEISNILDVALILPALYFLLLLHKEEDAFLKCSVLFPKALNPTTAPLNPKGRASTKQISKTNF